MMKMPRSRPALVITVIVGLIFLFFTALALHAALSHMTFMKLLAGRVFTAVLNRWTLLLGALVIVALFAAALWLVKRPLHRVLIVVAAVVVAVVGGGYHAINKRYPNENFFSAARYGEGVDILLGTDVALRTYNPGSFLIVDRKSVPRAAYPAIDIHFHLESLPPSIPPERLVAAMDKANVAKVINLGGLPRMYEHFALEFHQKFPDRFVMFVKPELAYLKKPNGPAELVLWIQAAARAGAQGMKISKSLGLGHRDENGKLLRIDDPRLDGLWSEAGRLGMPILMHTADPTAFFKPPDGDNERYEELLEFPEWSYYGRRDMPTKEELLAERERVVARHPETNFIGAHMGMNDDDLAASAAMLDRYPNYYVDMSSVVHSLGRQPNTTRRFFLKYQDRILFGTDGGYALENSGSGWTPERYFASYFEFLETDNDWMEYPLWGVNKQGRWHVSGLNLPPEVLEKIYAKNAEKLLPSHEHIDQQLAGHFPLLEEAQPIFAAWGAPPPPR